MEPKATIFSVLLFLLCTPTMLASNCDHFGGHHNRSQTGPTSQRAIIVDADGYGEFLSVQDAVDSIPENNAVRVVLRINAGHYLEKVVVPSTKPYVTFQGSGKEETVIEWHDRAGDRGPNGQQLRTYHTASVTVFANYFIARNISFKNSAPAPLPGMEGWQAAAFRISGDKAYFFGCGFYGAQDTLCDDTGRHYFKDCYIEGSIDFIFGNGQSLYKDRNSPCERTGFSFVGCRVTGTGKIYAGRAMGRYSRIVFADTYFDDVVAPGGWDDWDHDGSKKKTVFFGVYRCWGPGVESFRGAAWAHQLDQDTVRPFIAKSFINGRHWLGPWDV
ncbi:putative pectinesterase 68 [Platanthera guangdongensis]|uniref:Pectinesterase n=1 Tax=Platanthera guangdongensis TaxID=2320717 RepID=A0ABR2LGG3_9ASPA